MAKNNIDKLLDKVLPPFNGTHEELLEAVTKVLEKDHWPAMQAQQESCTMCPFFGQKCSKDAFTSVSKGGPGCMIRKVKP